MPSHQTIKVGLERDPDSDEIIRTDSMVTGRKVFSTLRWCETHFEPLWQFDDGTFNCPYALMAALSFDGCEITRLPWEIA